MSVVKINAITIPEGMGPQLEGRFAGRAKMVEQFDGFEDFQLLRPTPGQESGEDRYFVYTRWATEAHFQAWMDSQDFAKGHASAQADGNTDADGEQARKPVAQGAELMSFDVVEHVVKGDGPSGCSCGPECRGGDACTCAGSCDCGPDCNCGCCS